VTSGREQYLRFDEVDPASRHGSAFDLGSADRTGRRLFFLMSAIAHFSMAFPAGAGTSPPRSRPEPESLDRIRPSARA